MCPIYVTLWAPLILIVLLLAIVAGGHECEDMNDGSKSEFDNIDWNTDDEIEISSAPFSPYDDSHINQGTIKDSEKIPSYSTGSNSNSEVIHHFVKMGFSEKKVVRAIMENGEGDVEAILETLLLYKVLEEPSLEFQDVCIKPCSVVSQSSMSYNISDDDNSKIEEKTNYSIENDMTLSLLVDMGYHDEEALMAMDKCGPDAQIMELADYISAARMEKELNAQLGESRNKDETATDAQERPRSDHFIEEKKRKLSEVEKYKKKRYRESDKNQVVDVGVHFPNPMIGFGVPCESRPLVKRTLLDKTTAGPPYFYYENVGVWSRISRFLHDIEAEYVDSKNFCAVSSKRGYVHNLPIDKRSLLKPTPPLTICDALPSTKKWWPMWDKRTKLNCLQTLVGSAKVTERIRNELERHGDAEPPSSVQMYVTQECRKFNLVWIGKNKAAPLEPSELETLLGFPEGHTRGGGISTTDRYKALGNSSQVHTVAYHLSVLKDQFRNGINVLSLFTGIGGPEVALHRLGIPLKNVVSVKTSEANRNILRSWWQQTNQQGNLIEVADIEQVSVHRLGEWTNLFGGFDIVIGGSPCDNPAGGSHVSKHGPEGNQSSLLFDCCRILDYVRNKSNSEET
ncbi:hypothetical protein FNV43_RR25973 [Rhamnella rubrinervis]|uniref:DNA (cytosine-5-)-methyltransferase n=1 Tax=Rhamnella rubrinervis TaxID=2594499 RepID=A0A8K0DLR1_9ROSA|nr:hypothetical protein FNV43_RR25973 [Rhamnella rubrinervis]